MTNVVSMKEGAILDPKVIESIVNEWRSKQTSASTESSLLQLQVPAGRFRPRCQAIRSCSNSMERKSYMRTHNALSNCVLSINLAPKSPTEKRWMTYTLSQCELQALTVDFLKIRGQWRLHTSKGMPLPMQSSKPPPKRSAGQSSATLDLGCSTKLKSKQSRSQSGTNGSSFNRSRPVT
jgi:hypothetical protein